MLLPIHPGKHLTQNPKIIHLISKLKEMVYTPDTQFDSLYLQSLENFADYVQQLPSRRNFHFNQTNGMLLLGFLRAFQTIRLYREHTSVKSYARDKVPANIALWSYALYTAALLLGVGEIYATYWVSLCDAHGEFKQRWQPKLGPMTQSNETHYRYTFEQETRDAVANLDTLVVAEKILPAEGLAWIASDKYVYELWSAILTGDPGRAGPFAGFIIPTEDILLEQHRDLMQDLEDFLLHEQRQFLADEHSQELEILLTEINSIDDLSSEIREQMKEDSDKVVVSLPDSSKVLYIDLSSMRDTAGATDAFMYVFLRALSLGGYFIGTYGKMLAQGIAISPIMLDVLQKTFPQSFNNMNKKALGTTREGALVLDPTMAWPDKLPSLAATTDSKNAFTANPNNNNSPTLRAK